MTMDYRIINRIARAFFLSSVCLLYLSRGAWGADYFISTQVDFDTLKNATFAPGDNIFFEKGMVFNGMFAPTTVGAPGNVINISTFGTGDRPVIQNNGVLHPHPTRSGETVSAGVLLFNAEYVELRGLEITNNNNNQAQDNDDLMGIYILAEDTGKKHNHIYVEDNYIHQVNGAVAGKRRGGIHLHGYSPTSSNAASFNNVRIVSNVVDQIGGVGIGTDIDDDDIEIATTFPGANRDNAISNLYVAHNWIGNTGRNTVIARDSDYALYEYNTSANSSRHDTGHSFFNFKTIGITFQYNEAYGNTGPGTEADRGGFDADWNTRDTVYQYNYSHSNNWFMGIMKKPNTNVTIRYNLSVNEKLGSYFYGFENDTDVENVNVYNNTHYFNEALSPEVIVNNRTPHETTFNNNIFYAAGSGAAGTNADNGVNVSYDTNTYYNVTAPTSETNALTANPTLFSPGAEPYDVDMEFGRDVLAGYMLAPDSLYLNSGLTIANNGGLDFWGNPVSTSADGIGASEGITIPSAPVSIFTGGLFPGTGEAEVIAASLDAVGLNGDDAAISLAQTFQVPSSFDLRSIFLDYEFDPLVDPNEVRVNVEIFEVADVGAASIAQGKSLLTLTGLTMPTMLSSEETAIVLDSPLTLPATTGTAGYALRITNGGNPGFEWRRTGSTAGSVYAYGQAYEDGVEKLNGERDFVLALSSVAVVNSADFDGNGSIDGADFLKWQRGESPNPFSTEDLALWESQFGTSTVSAAILVPEPATSVLLLTFYLMAMSRSLPVRSAGIQLPASRFKY